MLRILLATGLLLVVNARAWGSPPSKPLPREFEQRTVDARRVLEEPINLELPGPDLEAALRTIAQATGVPIRIDLPTFMSEGLFLSQPAPKRISGPTLREALGQLWPDAVKGTGAIPAVPDEGAIQIDRYRWGPFPRSGTFAQSRWIVRGKVVDEAGQPVPRATLRLYCWAWVMIVAANDAGEFRAAVPKNGELVIQAWNESGALQGWSFTNERGAGEGQHVEYAPTVVVKPTKKVEVLVTSKGQPVMGAEVLVIAAGFPHVAGTTSADGTASIALPADAECDSAVAWKRGVGLDYVATREEGEVGMGKPALSTDSPINLQLSSAGKARFRIVDHQERPMANIRVLPWMLRKPGSNASMNLTHTHGRTFEVTNEAGIAEIDWLPAWQEEKVNFNASGPGTGYISTNITLREAVAAEQTLVIKRLTEVRGTVLDENGKPAAGVYVIARGVDRNRRSGHANGMTDHAGNFQLFVPQAAAALFVAQSRDGTLVSQPEERPVSDPETSVTDVTLYLRPAIRVFGQLGGPPPADSRKQPVLRLVGDDLHRRPDALPADADPGQPYRAVDEIQLGADETGKFSVLVGPGQYEFAPSPESPGIPFELMEQREYEVPVPPR